MIPYQKGIEIASATFPFGQINRIFGSGRLFWDDVHALYPSDEKGSHLLSFFKIDAVARRNLFLRWIADDILDWTLRENIECDVVFAPAHPATKKLTEEIARALRCRYAFLDYKRAGRLGDTLVADGEIMKHDRVLLFNSVVLVGGCIGKKLPNFAVKKGGEVVGVAAFAAGDCPKIEQLEQSYGRKFYLTIKVNTPVFKALSCPKCLAGDGCSLRPWTELV